MAELSTQRKIAIAQGLRSIVMCGRRVLGAGDRAQVRRGGIAWDLDLREGIDFAIFLLGGFELRTLRLYRRIIQPGATVLDIGANIGAHTLPFADMVGSTGRVVAFEPTEFAYAKLQRNLKLNPRLRERVTPLQMALVDSSTAQVPEQIYSSWPLDSEEGLHAVHRGRLRGTQGASAATLDDVVHSLKLERVDFIKLDVDGHEPEVLCGAAMTLTRFRPTVLLEWAPYLFGASSPKLDRAFAVLREAGYSAQVVGSQARHEIHSDVIAKLVPTGASVNLLLQGGR